MGEARGAARPDGSLVGGGERWRVRAEIAADATGIQSAAEDRWGVAGSKKKSVAVVEMEEELRRRRRSSSSGAGEGLQRRPENSEEKMGAAAPIWRDAVRGEEAATGERRRRGGGGEGEVLATTAP